MTVLRSLVALSLVGSALACAGVSAPPRPDAPRPVTRAELRRAIDSMVSAPKFRNAHWGILIVDPASGDTLYSRNAGKLFMPASNMKIITGAVALAQLGADYRYRTAFATSGTVRDSVLHGDLLVIGRGDPTISDAMRADTALAPLWSVADSLRARGITRIAGRVVPTGDAFPDAAWGYGWAWDDFDYPYSAGIDELLFNEGFAVVRVYGGDAPGLPARVETAPARTYPAVVAQVSTVEPAVDTLGNGGSRRRTLTAVRDSATGSIVVTGTIPVNDTAVLRFAHRDPTAAYLAALGEALADRGIAVGGPAAPADSLPAGTVVAAGTVHLPDSTPAPDTLFILESPPLREIMPALEKPSQNQIAEVLLKTIGLEATGSGTADSGRAVIERQLASWGADSMGYVVRDGSGLSRHNYLSPAAIVTVLDVMRRDSSFTVFYDALPIGGVDGTIRSRMRGTPAEGNVRAKTGYIDKARALSGYVTTADGRLLIFSFLANNWTTSVREVEQVQDAIAAMLASMRLAGR